MSKRVLWVVEMEIYEDGSWEPTLGVSLNREDGREELKAWRGRNQSVRFRLAKYRAVKVD